MDSARTTDLTLKLARAVLGVKANANAAAIRLAFREHAKRLHPDLHGGDAARFREMLEAYRLLQAAAAKIPKPAPEAPRFADMPPAVRPAPLYRPEVHITPADAMLGGDREAVLADGRHIMIHLPPGLRAGDLVRAGGEMFAVVMRASAEAIVRGNDLWMTAKVAPSVLAAGGRAPLATPIGRRVVWISKKAGERRLVRLDGQGLPARGAHKQGHLFVRLAPETEREESQARRLLRRFAESWAA